MFTTEKQASFKFICITEKLVLFPACIYSKKQAGSVFIRIPEQGLNSWWSRDWIVAEAVDEVVDEADYELGGVN